MTFELPSLEHVFIVHYDYQHLVKDGVIYNLAIINNDNTTVYRCDEGEILALEKYATDVRDLIDKGKVLVHWCQNTPKFGPQHICARYNKLTGNDLELSYEGGINLADFLIKKYGNSYVSHSRLDNLARLNNFSGLGEYEKPSAETLCNRTMLLNKIYFGAMSETLIIEIDIEQNDLERNLVKFGFNKLPKIIKLTDSGRIKIIKFLRCHSLGECIAMMGNLDFIESLYKYFKTKRLMYREIGSWFGKNERDVAGQIRMLSGRTGENSEKFNSWKFKDNVDEFYNSLN